MLALLTFLAGALPAQTEPGRDIPLSVTIEHRDGGGPLVLALGDTLWLKVGLWRCPGDFCIPDPATTLDPVWIVDPSDLTVANGGAVVGRRIGVYPIAVRVGSLVAWDSVEVLPPVNAIEWFGIPSTAFQGDTIRVGLHARDSLGRIVGRLTAAGSIGGTGRSGIVLNYDDHGRTVVFLDRPGVLELMGTLAHRRDTLRLTIRRR